MNEGFLDLEKETIHRNKDPINKRSMKKDCSNVSHQAEGVSQDTLLLPTQRRQGRPWIFPRAEALRKTGRQQNGIHSGDFVEGFTRWWSSQ